jgi:membrane-bound serine protease (ClpP class)
MDRRPHISNLSGLAVALGLLIAAHWNSNAQDSSSPRTVSVVPIAGTIDLGLAPFLSRAIQEAHAQGAAAVLLEINTFGGRVDAAVAMRDTLLQSPVPTIAFVNQRAISAGALIALACETIVMTDGGTIGAAAPVVSGAGEMKPADEKSVSYLRKEFRATADVRKRPPQFAEAMVDADVEIPKVVGKGKLLTLTSAEAIQHKVADFTAPDVQGALRAAGLAGAFVRTARETWAESVVRFLTNPIVSSLMMSLGLLGILVEIRTPGFALPGTIGLLSLGLFFWGHWIVRLAGWEELLLVSIGTLLIALEIFVIPGTSLAGIAGGAMLLAGLGMTLVGAGATVSVIINALGRVAASILLAMAGTLLLLRLMPHLPFGQRLVLATGMEASLGYVSAPATDRQWLGRAGTAVTPLRPSGIAEIDGARVDVVSDGGFIEIGAAIEVTRVEGNRIVVRRPLPHQKEEAHG